MYNLKNFSYKNNRMRLKRKILNKNNSYLKINLINFFKLSNMFFQVNFKI